MENIFEQTLLYDFYGELLTAHQQNIYEDAVYNDMSLSELAQEHGISRQGVHDLIRRCDRILQEYESKLHLVEKFMGAKEKIRRIESLTNLEDISNDGPENLTETNTKERMRQIRELTQELMKDW